MKERLKMIFGRVDIFVVCIILGLCLCIVEAFIGNWDVSADCAIMVFLVSEVCYTNRCKEKLEIELIEAKEKLKEAEKESDKNAKKCRIIRFYVLLEILWRERWSCEHAKVNYCKHRITLRQLIDAMNRSDKRCDEISNKISELAKELNELDK
mgnify:CR=1 FL=1|jgi:hypothetical protein